MRRFVKQEAHLGFDAFVVDLGVWWNVMYIISVAMVKMWSALTGG